MAHISVGEYGTHNCKDKYDAFFICFKERICAKLRCPKTYWLNVRYNNMSWKCSRNAEQRGEYARENSFCSM